MARHHVPLPSNNASENADQREAKSLRIQRGKHVVVDGIAEQKAEDHRTSLPKFLSRKPRFGKNPNRRRHQERVDPHQTAPTNPQGFPKSDPENNARRAARGRSRAVPREHAIFNKIIRQRIVFQFVRENHTAVVPKTQKCPGQEQQRDENQCRVEKRLFRDRIHLRRRDMKSELTRKDNPQPRVGYPCAGYSS